MSNDWMIGLGAAGLVLIFILVWLFITVAAFLIGGFIATQIHSTGLIWWSITIIIGLLIIGVLNYINKK